MREAVRDVEHSNEEVIFLFQFDCVEPSVDLVLVECLIFLVCHVLNHGNHNLRDFSN